MAREVRYCTTEDGVRIAYCVEGEGPPLVRTPVFIESFSLDDLRPDFMELFQLAGQGSQLIRFDGRGTGLSQRDVPDMSLAAGRLDIEAVVHDLGLKGFSLWGTAIGGLRAIDYAVAHPEQVTRLGLWATYARVRDVFPPEVLRGLAALARSNWDLTARTLADFAGRRGSEQLGLPLAEWFRRSISGEMAARLFEANADLDLAPLLPKVKVPTLIVHPIDDPLYPISLAQELAAAIPNARLAPLAGLTYSINREEFADIIYAFFSGDAKPRPRPTVEPSAVVSAFRTVLFTDLVGHTEMMQRLGDEKGRDVLREHERITRDVLKANGGTEVKTLGDGFLASFGSVTKAVECAVALQRAFHGREGEPLSVRVGINAGEPIEEDGDLFGSTVILASRIAAKAEGGEILVANTVRELCAGKAFSFADRGEFEAKGFEEPVRVYEVDWRA
jgi:class 3 adenylate cyclase/pimeloyl-ACP methyl ester carboxylesterase